MSRICARCEHFSTKDPDDETRRIPQAAHGIGRCTGFDGHVAPVEPYVRWDAPHCILFGKAKDMDARKKWIEVQARKEEEK